MRDLHEQLRAYGAWVEDQREAASDDGAPRSARAAPQAPAEPSSRPRSGGQPGWRPVVLLAAGVAVVAALAAGAAVIVGDDPTVETQGLEPTSGDASSTPEWPGPIGPVDPCEPDPYAERAELRPALAADLPDGWWLTGSQWNRGMFGDRGVGVTWRDDAGRTLEVEVVQVARELHRAWMPPAPSTATITGRPALVSIAMVHHRDQSVLDPHIVIGLSDFDGSGWVVRHTTTGVEHTDALALAASVDIEAFLAAQASCPVIDAPGPDELWTRVGGPGQWVAPGTFSPEVLRAIPAGQVAALPVYADDRSTVVRYLLWAAWQTPNGPASGQIGDVPAGEVERWRQHVDAADDRLPPGLDVAALAPDLLFPLGRG